MGDNKKLARNEQLIRNRNQGAAVVIKKYYQHEKGLENEPLDFLCECSDLKCTLTVPVSFQEYNTIHKDKTQFVLAAGHENPKIEKITSKRKDYEIVEKLQLAK